MFDVFYLDAKPGLFPHEKPCDSIQTAQRLSRTRYCWIVTYLADYQDWDWLWEPPPWQSHQIHAWASQWQKDSGVYLAPKIGGQDINYHAEPVIRRLPNRDNWEDPDSIIEDFDYSWHPDPTEPPMIYQFGTQHQRSGGPRYIVPNAHVIKYVELPRCYKVSVDDHWKIPSGCNVSQFDWTWHPDPTEPPYIYEFGTQWQKTGGPRYVVPGATEVKYMPSPRVEKISQDSHWSIPEGAVVESFDWTWHPDATEQPYIYQFGTQHQRTGGPIYHVPGATDIKFVDQIRIQTQRTATAIVLIDHLDGHVESVRQQITVDKTVRYFDNYLDTLRRIAKNLDGQHEFVWIISSLCDYSQFDFSWHPEQWQAGMLHVFASGDQKFGDTFFMHVPTFAYRADTCQLLEWYDVNFIKNGVERWPMPVIHHDHDSQVPAVKQRSWAGPLALFTTTEHVQSDCVPVVPLWREKTRTIVSLDPGGESVIVPRDAVSVVKSQLYDYPHIDKTRQFLTNQPLDIVFIDHGEHGADLHWQILNQNARGYGNIHRISGITGRVAAYQAAARISTTPWFFAVFAKLQVNDDFDWTWQPDRLQEAKHYIFHAFNPVNNLVYGHQAMIAYNRRLVLENSAQGLDFTLDQAHEVVPIVSGTAYYDNDPWTCWRTAFREVIKLRYSLPDVENEYRLEQWLKVGQGTNGSWSIQGAQDAMEYYDSVGGNFEELRKSYEWAWLASYALLKRNLIADSK